MNIDDHPPRLPLRVRSPHDISSFVALHPHETGYSAAYALAVAAHQCFGTPLPYADVGWDKTDGPERVQGTVLVVDDNLDIVDLIRLTLEDEGYRVIVTMGSGAMDAARDHQPDLILMDMVMPGMDGLEASQLLRDEASTAHIPVVAMTGLPLLKRAAGLPVVDHLPKPFTVETLLAMVAKWIPAPENPPEAT